MHKIDPEFLGLINIPFIGKKQRKLTSNTRVITRQHPRDDKNMTDHENGEKDANDQEIQ